MTKTRRGDVVLVLFPNSDSEIDSVLGNFPGMPTVDAALGYTVGLNAQGKSAVFRE
jgi:hypothetical protein